MLGYSDQVTQKHAAEAGNTWAQYASVTDRSHSPTTPPGRTMTTDSPEDRPTVDAEKQDSDTSEPTLFDVDPPVRPYDLHLESLGTAAAAVDEALDEARTAAQLAKEQLTQVVVEGRRAGLSWRKLLRYWAFRNNLHINAGRGIRVTSMT